MKVSIHQPQYWPWPPYIHKVMSADLFVYLDIVQFSKNGFQNRNMVKGQTGPLWLTIPVIHDLEQSIQYAHGSGPKILQKHWRTLQANYANTEGFKKWGDEIWAVLDRDPDDLCSVLIDSTDWLLKKLGVDTPTIKASELVDITGHGTELVASICRSVSATSYLTGSGALDYMESQLFSDIGCEVLIQDWQPLTYNQVNSKAGFIPNLSTLDLLLNCPDDAREKIENSGSWEILWAK